MRTYILSAATAVTVGLMTLVPASAENAPWTCMSPAFACGGAPTAKTYRTRDSYDAERSYRRQASGKRSRRRVASQETAKPKVERKQQAKIALPERKQLQAKAEAQPAKAPEQKTAAVDKKSEVAVRKVETESTYRVTSTQSGIASYYGYGAGSQTASGQRFNPNAMTAAHRTLPFGTKVRVTNKRNGKSVVVTINDRGPFIRGRVIDLSTAAAGVIGMKSSGLAPVTVERIAAN
jgi:rare lipoprotein A